MIVIAHRGANKEALENSYDAFERAVQAGAHRIELDVHLTRDGHPVVIHDHSLKHMLGIARKVGDLTRQEISQLKLPNGEGLPFLDEVIERFLNRIELNIEIKGHSSELAEKVGAMLHDHRQREKIIVSCFHREPLEYLADEYPELKRACLWGEDNLGWPRFAHYAPGVFLDICRTNILHPKLNLIDSNLMDQAHARGWIIYGWSPMIGEDGDREGIWTTLKTLGVHGFCTNYPRQLVHWLKEASLDEASYHPEA